MPPIIWVIIRLSLTDSFVIDITRHIYKIEGYFRLSLDIANEVLKMYPMDTDMLMIKMSIETMPSGTLDNKEDMDILDLV